MSALRDQIIGYINEMSDDKLRALQPLLSMLHHDEEMVYYTDLNEEDKQSLATARQESIEGKTMALDEYLNSRGITEEQS